jgi:ribosomal protein S12 methylthiotransferase
MKYRIVSLGCPKNLVDSEQIAGRLEGAGWELSDDADLIVVNTCAFIADACSESIDTILEEAKRSDKKKRLVVTGCLVERYGKELESLLPEVDAFVKRESYGNIESVALQEGQEASASEGSAARKVLTPVPTVYLKIQEGCNNRCSYCTIPSIRGGLDSRNVDDIETEFAALLASGYREFNLIGQDTTSFGKDKGTDVKSLLTRLLSVEGDYFLRLLYLHPKGVDDELLEVMAGDDRVIPYLDVPIQHSEDRLLKSMNRGYSRQDLEILFEKIRKRTPDAVLRTTVMVGYPTETEEDFRSLCDFVSRWEFDNLGAFMYSRESGTPAARIKGHVGKKIKKGRYQAIMELQKDISRRRLSRLLGRTMKVVIEGREGESTTGRLLLQAPDVDGIAFIRGDCSPGEIRVGRVTRTLDYDVVVELESPT